MKIALLGPSNEFCNSLFEHLQPALSPDTLLRWSPGDPPPANDLDVVLGLSKFGPSEIAACPHLGLLQTVSDGYDSVDIDAATQAGIWVSYAPGAETGNADSVAEFAVLLLLAASRRLNQALAFDHNTSLPKPMLNRSLVGKKVCIVGAGSIGQMIADRLRPFAVELSALDRHPGKAPANLPTRSLDDLHEVLADQDYVVLCIRGTADNTHMVDASFFAAMKPGSTFVNIARGSLVDEAALTDALRSGHLYAAGLDVLEHEPPHPGNPLLAIPQAFITPHIAGFTDLTRDGAVRFVTGILQSYRAGKRFPSLLNQPKTPRHPLA